MKIIDWLKFNKNKWKQIDKILKSKNKLKNK